MQDDLISVRLLKQTQLEVHNIPKTIWIIKHRNLIQHEHYEDELYKVIHISSGFM